MSQTLTIDNFDDINIIEVAQLDADAPIGSSALTIAYGDNFAQNDYIYIGKGGAESGEVRIVGASPTATSLPITVATTKLHKRFNDVTKLFGNQIKLYRVANVSGTPPADVSFALVGAATTIDYDQSQTSITDPTGDGNYWYKFTYYNSTTTAETSLGDSLAVRSFGNYCSVEDIRREAGLMNARSITDSMIDSKRQAAQAYINATLAGTYVVPFAAPINPLIIDITKVLAAGYLLTDNYGPTSTLNTNQGQAKIDYVMGKTGQPGMLERINNGSIKLIDALGSPSDVTTPGVFGGYPTSTTATSDIDGNPSPFGFKRTTRY